MIAFSKLSAGDCVPVAVAEDSLEVVPSAVASATVGVSGPGGAVPAAPVEGARMKDSAPAARDEPAANVDPDEVAFYERLASTWWDPSGPFWPLHTLNTLRVPWIVDAACRHFGRDASAPQPLAGRRLFLVFLMAAAWSLWIQIRRCEGDRR